MANKNVRYNKNEFKNLFENMYEGFALHEIIIDSKGRPVDYRFLNANSAFEKITGLKLKTIKGKTVKEILPQTEQYWIDTYGEVALKGKSTSFSNYSSELDKYFNVNAYSPSQNYFVTIITDVTFEKKARGKIEKEKQFFKMVVESTISGYWDWDLENDTEYYSPSFKKMLGYNDDELDNFPATWRRLVFSEDIPAVHEQLNKNVANNREEPFYNEVRYHHKNGSTVWTIRSGRVVEWDGDRPLRIVGCHCDITKTKELERIINEERNLFKTTLHSIGDGVISTDIKGKVNIMNDVAEKLTGWTNVEAKEQPFQNVFNIINEFTRNSCKNPVDEVLETGKIIELENHTLLIKKNKEEVYIEDSAAPIMDENGKINGAVLVFRDCTEKKLKQREIEHLSYHDYLTGLYNRRFFEEELKRMNTERNLPLTIMMVDVNGLKLTNDAFGHKTGDLLLKSLAEVLESECRKDDIVSRIGGDEFVVLLPKTNNDETELIASRIYKAVSNKKINNIILSVSIGWSVKTESEEETEKVLSMAEDYMYRKKINESQSMRNQTVKIIMQTLNECNIREQIHSERVSKISRKIGEAMNLGNEELKNLETAGLMHDIGKIAIDRNILNKSGKLSEAEYEEVKRHPEIGYHILKSVDLYTKIAEYVLLHHERWDGNGYPRGISGKEIPLVARIIAVADSYEAMTAERPYQKTKSNKEALLEIERCAGTQFDPEVVKAFLKIANLGCECIETN